MKEIIQKIGIGAIVGALVYAAVPGLAQRIVLNPIKPVVGQVNYLSDEQQGILAVRSVKPAVVDILGVSPGESISLDATATSSDYSSDVEGTGFIIDSSGIIVSNNHVVQNPDLNYSVILSDGTTYPAKVMGMDKFDDVALLKIDAQNMPVIKFGDSSALETGQSVFAIGNSLGRYQNTVTRGVVSGLGRTIDSADLSGALPRMQQLIQTDAAINPGNSGGPLIDLSGEVVGMNTMIDQQGEGLGFAIPSNTIKDVVQQLETFGKASRPYLGVSFMTLNNFFTAGKAWGVTQGAYLVDVVTGGPADAAGLKQGDIVTAINHHPLTETNELDVAVSGYQAGNQILMTYNRAGQSFDAVVLLSAYK